MYSRVNLLRLRRRSTMDGAIFNQTPVKLIKIHAALPTKDQSFASRRALARFSAHRARNASRRNVANVAATFPGRFDGPAYSARRVAPRPSSARLGPARLCSARLNPEFVYGARTRGPERQKIIPRNLSIVLSLHHLARLLFLSISQSPVLLSSLHFVLFRLYLYRALFLPLILSLSLSLSPPLSRSRSQRAAPANARSLPLTPLRRPSYQPPAPFPRGSSPSSRVHALSRPSSGFHRFRVCTWARRSIFQAVAHEKRSSWGRVPPHRYGRRWRRRQRRRQRRRRRRTKPGVTSPLVRLHRRTREKIRESCAGIISSRDAGASGYVRARPPPPPPCRRRERARDERARIAESMIMILTKCIYAAGGYKCVEETRPSLVIAFFADRFQHRKRARDDVARS